MLYVWLACGGAMGTLLRYWLSTLIAASIGEAFPWGTLLINALGCFIMGFFASLTRSNGQLFFSSEIRSFVMIGLCGGFTTFSSYSLQTLVLAKDGHFLKAGTYLLLSNGLCLLFVWLGSLASGSLPLFKGV